MNAEYTHRSDGMISKSSANALIIGFQNAHIVQITTHTLKITLNTFLVQEQKAENYELTREIFRQGLTCFHSSILERDFSGRIVHKPRPDPIKLTIHRAIGPQDLMLRENMPNICQLQSSISKSHEFPASSVHNHETGEWKSVAPRKT